MAIPELALNTKAMITIIMILFSGKNQFATNFEALINLKGKPIKEINCPTKKNQKETFIKIAKIDPIKVNAQPNIIYSVTYHNTHSNSIRFIYYITWYYHNYREYSKANSQKLQISTEFT